MCFSSQADMPKTRCYVSGDRALVFTRQLGKWAPARTHSVRNGIVIVIFKCGTHAYSHMFECENVEFVTPQSLDFMTTNSASF